MHFSTALAAAAAVVPMVNAHGDAPHVPKIFGLNVRDLKARNMMDSLKARTAAVQSEAHAKKSVLNTRQNTDGQCGEGFGSCAPGVCCSGAGWCGTGPDYCYAPGCNYKFGPGCPDNAVPAGADTANVARPKVGSVPYGGAGIYACVNPGTVALTYDDGPQRQFTDHILDVFKSYNAKATFFITGNNINKGQIDITEDHTSAVKRAYAEGHQIASHTWTHQDLSAISSEDRKLQMTRNEMAIRNILGIFPTYMRPPYSSCTAESGCEQDMADLGYHVTYFNVDTDDYNQDAADEIQNSKNWFKGNITAGGATPQNSEWLSIAHDIHEQTAMNLTEFMLSTLTQLGYKAVTVGECLGDPVENWYRTSDGQGTIGTTTTAGSNPTQTSLPQPTGKVSTDATCGGDNGFTCQGSTFGNCCSASGWCGSTDAYCGTGCQTGFGTCGSNTTPANPTNTPSPSNPAGGNKGVSTDGTCGTSGFTCQGSTFGNCCSEYGWCGSTTGHCGTGCQSGFGTCGNNDSPSAPSVDPTPIPSSPVVNPPTQPSLTPSAKPTPGNPPVTNPPKPGGPKPNPPKPAPQPAWCVALNKIRKNFGLKPLKC